MTEEQAEYKVETQEAMEMLGKGYDHPSLEIHPQQTVISKRGWKMQEEIIPAFVKVSTAFKQEMESISGNAIKVWLFIALSINRDTDQARPGLRTIAKACNLSINTVTSMIKELEQHQLLSVDREGNKYNIYEIPEYVSVNSRGVSKNDTVEQSVSIENQSVSKKSQSVSTGKGLTREPELNHINEEGKKTQNVFKLFEQEIGVLTPMIAQSLGDDEDEHGPAWVCEAIKIASQRGARNYKYISAILKRWKVDGYGVDMKKNGNKAPSTTQDIFATIDRVLDGK